MVILTASAGPCLVAATVAPAGLQLLCVEVTHRRYRHHSDQHHTATYYSTYRCRTHGERSIAAWILNQSWTGDHLGLEEGFW